MTGLAFGFTLGIIMTMQTAAAQTPNPTSGLKFLDQKAYVYTIPPLEVQQQQQAISTGNPLTDMLVPIVVALTATAAGKIHSDKKAAKETAKVAEVTIDNSAEILKGKTVDKEIAKVAFNANPEAAAKITDAPLIKLQTLATDETAFAAKAVKTTLPIPDE
jgi:hypothetical protein